jgi:hypothetical protein
MYLDGLCLPTKVSVMAPVTIGRQSLLDNEYGTLVMLLAFREFSSLLKLHCPFQEVVINGLDS